MWGALSLPWLDGPRAWPLNPGRERGPDRETPQGGGGHFLSPTLAQDHSEPHWSGACLREVLRSGGLGTRGLPSSLNFSGPRREKSPSCLCHLSLALHSLIHSFSTRFLRAFSLPSIVPALEKHCLAQGGARQPEHHPGFNNLASSPPRC